MKEIELKFIIPEKKQNIIKRQTHIKSTKVTHLTAHYFDTPEQTLADNGIAVRIRQEVNDHKNDWVQTLKTNGDGIASRVEHNHLLDSQQAEQQHQDNTLRPDFRVYEETQIAKILSAVWSHSASDIDKVGRLYSTDVQRHTRLIKQRGNVKQDNTQDNIIEVAHDVGEVIHATDPNQRQVIHEVEFELISGDTEFLFQTAKTWCQRYQLCLSTITKAERGSLVLSGDSHPQAIRAKLKGRTLEPTISKAEFMRSVVHNCLLQILPNASAIVEGSVPHADNLGSPYASEHVHQLRVGMRRLRTALKFFAGFSNGINPDWNTVLKDAFNQLGEYRDRDVLQHKTQPMLVGVGSPYVDWSMDDSITMKPMMAVANSAFQLMLLELIAFAMSEVNPTTETKNTLKHAKKAVSKILDKVFNKVSRDSDNFAELDIEAQHDVRKRLKSLRYLSEFSSPLYQDTEQDTHAVENQPTKPKQAKQSKKAKKQDKKQDKKQNEGLNQQKSVKQAETALASAKVFIKYLKPAQEVLGDYNDNIVGYELYAQKAINEPNAYFAVGWFLANEKQSAQVCADYLKVVKDAPKFW